MKPLARRSEVNHKVIQLCEAVANGIFTLFLLDNFLFFYFDYLFWTLSFRVFISHFTGDVSTVSEIISIPESHDIINKPNDKGMNGINFILWRATIFDLLIIIWISYCKWQSSFSKIIFFMCKNKGTFIVFEKLDCIFALWWKILSYYYSYSSSSHIEALYIASQQGNSTIVIQLLKHNFINVNWQFQNGIVSILY
jgi:hypothetical protein